MKALKKETLLDSFDGMEDFKHFLNDERPQVVKSLDGFSHKLQHIGGGGLVGVAQELHQLQTRGLFLINTHPETDSTLPAVWFSLWTRRTAHHWDDVCCHVGEAHAARVERAHQQLPVLVGVFVFCDVVCLDHLLFQNDHQLGE